MRGDCQASRLQAAYDSDLLSGACFMIGFALCRASAWFLKTPAPPLVLLPPPGGFRTITLPTAPLYGAGALRDIGVGSNGGILIRREEHLLEGRQVKPTVV